MRLRANVICFALLALSVDQSLLAQSLKLSTKVRPNGDVPGRSDASKKSGKFTTVEVELLQTTDGSGLYSQQWMKALEPLDVKVQIHRPSAKDEPDVKQRESGGVRVVTAVGVIERTGRIVFPEKSFDLGESVKLREWIEELRTYGAQGSSVGQPLWGLTKPQFVAIFDGLTKPIDFSTEGILVTELIRKVPLPNKTRIEFSSEAKKRIDPAGSKSKVRHELKGFSIGTALAIGLNDVGLGFRPSRTPDGAVDLLVEPRQPGGEQWTIGWPLQRQKQKAAPKFLAPVPIELPNVELLDVITAAREISETPIIIDYAEIEAKQIDLKTLKVNFPRKVSNWSIVLNRALISNRMVHEMWQDEGGRVFVWITTARAARSRDADHTKTEP